MKQARQGFSFYSAIAILYLVLSGCAPALEQLKTDPAIVGITGWWMSIGIEPVGGIPMPVVRMARGTLWRVGVSEAVEIRTGEQVVVDATKAEGQNSRTMGGASLIIRTENTSKALEKMKDLYGK